ncbi:MAG TPA: glycosyltransferase family 4 protein [Rhodothermales bacterium]|nr:glycosyltransferase family 4 protein [Rhodothermales bacterium]
MTKTDMRGGTPMRSRQQAAHPPRLVYVGGDAAHFLGHRLALARAAAAQGFEVHVATAPSRLGAEIEGHGLRWHAVPVRSRSLNPLRDLAFTGALVRLYRRLRPALVHHVTIKPVLYGGLAARMAGVPAVVNALTGLGYLFMDVRRQAHTARWLVQPLLREAFRHPHLAGLFENPDDAALLVERRLLRPEQVRVVVGAGVDLERFHPPTTPPAGPPLVVMASRLLRSKGVDEFVHAARLLRARGVTARFALVGARDPLNPTCLSAAEVESIRNEGVVEVWGHCQDMPAVWRQAHVACLPSYREGAPVALLEAAATGLPLVATDVPGCRAVVRAGENGLLVPPMQAEPLADALARLIGDERLRAKMGASSLRRAELEFRVEHVVEAIFAIYAQLLGQAGSAFPRPA